MEQVEVQGKIIPRCQLHGGGELNKREDTPGGQSSLVVIKETVNVSLKLCDVITETDSCTGWKTHQCVWNYSHCEASVFETTS